MAEIKHIIAVRHGMCESNKAEIFQAGDQFEIDPLTEEGRQQAEAVAARFEGVPVDIILSTSYLRGQQTARPIQQVTGAPIVVPVLTDEGIEDKLADTTSLGSHTSLLRELDLPSELAGLTFKDPVAVAVKDEIKQHLYEKDWRYSDEENLYDVWDRAGKILEYLEQRPEDIIAVVAHGGILKACMARILQKDVAQELTERQQLEIYQSFSAQTWWDNTGVVSLRYSDDEGWQWIITDNTHLGTAYFGFMQDERKQDKEEKSDTAPGDVYDS